MKLVTVTLAAAMTLTACRHAEVGPQQAAGTQARTPVNPSGYFAGHRPTDAEIQSYSPMAPTPEQIAADKAIEQRIVGTWTATERSDSAQYPVLAVRADGTYAVTTKQGKPVSEGTWALDRGVLLLKERNATPASHYGFHAIDQIDDHHLVCGIDISVAGRLRFTK